eukprot:jgi/Hompol1/6535/HPOL_000188-RA
MQDLLMVISLHAQLEYLTLGLDAAQTLLESTLQQCQPPIDADSQAQHSLLEEYILEVWARLLFNHANSGLAFKPVQLRDLLERALLRYPANTLFLTLFGWNEARTGVDGRVRRIVDQLLSSHPSHTIALFAAWSEMHQRSNTNINVVRSVFDRAIEMPRLRYSTSIWYLAIQFEARVGELARGKSLFYRAISECPWAKEDELRELYAIMEDKEIRIRAPVAEM